MTFPSHQTDTSNVLPLAPTQRTRAALTKLEGHIEAQAHAIWCLQSKRLAGLEFLARARHPDGGQWDPESFVPLAQKGGCLDALTLGVVRKMQGCLGQIPRAIRANLFFSVNVSPGQLRNRRFVEQLATRLAAIAGEGGTRLVVEITEGQKLGMDALINAACILGQNGLGIALDDFGSEYANHARLATIPWDIVKFDRALVENIPYSTRARTVMQAAIGMARNLGALTVAEGVENNRQRAWLAESGCHLAQGFLWARPLGINQVVSSLGRCT